jgi:Pro-kumamolisin, activation domain
MARRSQIKAMRSVQKGVKMSNSFTPIPLRGSERPRPDTHKLKGAVDPEKLIGVTLLARPRPGSAPPPDLATWRSTPLSKRRVLSREEYARVHGADPADLQKVALFAATYGLRVAESHVGRRAVTLEGKPAQFNAAFGITLLEFEAPTPNGGSHGAHAPGLAPSTYLHHGHDGPVVLPAELDGIVFAVVGLDDRIRGGPAGRAIPADRPGASPEAGTEDPPNAAYITVPNLAKQYNFPTSGAPDQTIGVFAGPGGAYLQSDVVNQYFPSLPSGYTKAPNIQDVDLVISGVKYKNNSTAVNKLQNRQSNLPATYVFSSANSGIIELTQDISTSSTIAQGATVNVYFNDNSEQGWLVFLMRVLQPQTEKGPSVVTCSWVFNLGDDANGTSNYVGIGDLTNNPLTPSSSIVDWMSRQLTALASVGVDVFIAIGDWGADNWFLFPTPPDGAGHVMYPASDPSVISCGGTVIGPTAEYVWGYPYTTTAQSAFGSSNSNRAATGGGFSKTFTSASDAPYQAGVISQSAATDNGGTVWPGRGVPDIAGMVALTGFIVNTTIGYQFIGTSCVAPLYAGLAAVIKSALGQQLGPLNDTLYALRDVAFNDITSGTNNSGDTPPNVTAAITAINAAQTPPLPPYTGPTNPNAPYFSAGAGWDACTGLGSIDGTKLLNGIASLLYNQTFYFQVNKGSFGLDEVQINATYSNPTPLWLVLEGFTPNAVIAAGIAPTVTSEGPPGIEVTVGGPQWEIATALDTPQRVYFPCSITFAASAIASTPPGIFPAPGNPPTPTQVLLVAPSFFMGAQLLPAAETILTLEPGADPYFANFANNGEFYLSQDLRVFTVTPGVNPAPIDGVISLNDGPDHTAWNTSAGYTYIKALLAHLNGQYNNPSGPDPFTLFPDQTNALSGDSSVTPTTVNPANATKNPYANYNFAVARVRLDGTPNTSSVANVRVLFRLFASQTSDTDFQPPTYPSTNDSEGQPLVPQLGVGNVTIPFFATGNYDANSDHVQNIDYVNSSGQEVTSINNQPVQIGYSGQVWAYYGCYLNIYPTGNTIDLGSPLGKVPVQSLLPSSHSCVVAQLIYDDAPAPTGPGVLQGPEYSDNFAQRNLQITFSDNPGPAAAHRIPQTFDTRPGPAAGTGELENYPDELMIAWGDTPVGSVASIYWPAVGSAEVLALAKQFYSTHQLSAADAHTIQCVVPKGLTFVPIPAGTGENYAGLFSVDLPQTVITGQTFTITFRRISTYRAGTSPQPEQPKIKRSAAAEFEKSPPMRNWRYVVGTFAVRIPVTTAKTMLPLEENTLSIMKWRLSQMSPPNRWIPVLERYIGLIEGRVRGLGGNPASIEPSPWGAYGPPKPGESGEHGGRRRHEATGKVNGVIYDRFGDFEGFLLLTEEGHERGYHSREAEIEALARYAWVERAVITVVSEDHRPETPVKIILRRAPPAPYRPGP